MRPGARTSGLPFNLERYNVLYMGFFSIVVIAGTLYSVVHKTHSYNVLLSDAHSSVQVASSLLNTGDASTSALPKIPATFLADRRNLLNRVFTKFAWFWTFAAFLAQIVTLRTVSPRADVAKTRDEGQSVADGDRPSSAEREKQARQKNATAAAGDANLQATIMGAMSISLLRFTVATLLWVFFARWFIGPSLMERIRHYSGATCVPIHIQPKGSGLSGVSLGNIEAQYCYNGKLVPTSQMPHLFTNAANTDSLTGSTLSAVEGLLHPRWRGGHDISGHTYILIVSSLYILEEITPFLPYLLPVSLYGQVAKILPRALWAPHNPFVASAQQSQQVALRNRIAITGILLLLALWSTSLAITAVYFHTPQEKISGLLVALAASLLIPKGG